jgi:O-glycosyl hydrolase
MHPVIRCRNRRNERDDMDIVSSQEFLMTNHLNITFRPWLARSAWALLAITFSHVALAVDTVAVDAGVMFQRMDGFGMSSRVFDDPHLFDNFDPNTGRALTVMSAAQQDAVLDRLFIDLGLTRLRPASPDVTAGAGIEPVNYNNDPYVKDHRKFSNAWKNLDAHVDMMMRAQQRGATTFFLSPLSRETRMGETTTNDAAEYAEWLLAQVRRSRDQGIVLPFLSVANEPSYSRNPMSGTFLRDVIKDLGPRLRAEGFATLFVLPDDVRASDAAAKAQVVLSDPVARPYVGALATHLYDEPVSNVGQLQAVANQYQLPLWMTEFTVGAMGTAGLPANAFSWAALMHDLIATYNVSAVDYLWGFFGQWEGNTTMLVTLNNNGAAYQGMTLNKQYYTTGQYSRFVRPGSRRIQATSSANAVLTTAYLDRSSLVVVAINTDTVDHSVTFSLAGVPLSASATVQPTRTSASDNWALLAPITVSGSGFATTLAHNSVTTFVTSTNDGIFVDGFENMALEIKAH